MRRRPRLRSLLLLLLGLLVLVLLLEMNRWLPGTWPGGSNRGFREVVGGDRDPSRVRPPETVTETIPPGKARIAVRGPQGTEPAGWRFGRAGGATDTAPVERGSVVADLDSLRDGFRLTKDDGTLAHGPSPFPDARAATVFVPDGPLPTSFAPPATAEVALRFHDEEGKPLEAKARLVTPEGTPIPMERASDGAWRATVSETAREGLVVEALVEGRPLHRSPVPAGGEPVVVPSGRAIEVHALDERRAPVAGAQATARYASGDVSASEPTEVSTVHEADSEGRATLPVPPEGSVTVLVEAPGRAPAVRRITAADGTAPVETVLEKGLELSVRVLDPEGRPVRDARVVAAAAVENVSVIREAATGSDGRAVVGSLPPGELEVYASAAGFGWRVARAQARSASGTVEVRLVPGRPLRVFVETPDGKPLAGVRVRLRPQESGGDPDPVPPSEPPAVTDERGALLVPALPERDYTLHLSAPGYRAQTLRGCRPGDAVHYATMVPGNP